MSVPTAFVLHAKAGQKAVEGAAVVYVNLDFFDSDGSQGGLHRAKDFGVANGRVASNRIDVALDKFAVAAGLGLFSAPNFGYVVALKGKGKLGFVLGGKAREWNGKVKAHRYVAAAIVLKAEDLLFGLAV